MPYSPRERCYCRKLMRALHSSWLSVTFHSGCRSWGRFLSRLLRKHGFRCLPRGRCTDCMVSTAAFPSVAVSKGRGGGVRAARALAKSSCVSRVAPSLNIALWRNWRATADEDGHYSLAIPL